MMTVITRMTLWLSGLLGTSAWAGEWSAWRGPRGDGVSEESNVPVRWSSTGNIAWKVAIPGRGHSSPIIWGDRVFVTTYVEQGNRRVLLCLDRLTDLTARLATSTASAHRRGAAEAEPNQLSE